MVAVHKIISAADILVWYNGKKFDRRRANTEFIKHGLTPPPPSKTVDPLITVRSEFDLNSNKMDDVGKFLGVGEKVKHSGFSLWRRCIAGDLKAWAEMEKYNRGDVGLLERIYLKVRPWIRNHPSLTITEPVNHGVKCPACKGARVHRRGWNLTTTGRNPRYQCQDCGKWCAPKKVKKEWRLV